MRYATFRDAIYGQAFVARTDLEGTIALPYDRPCPEWIKAMEREIGLKRESIAARGRALVWRIDHDPSH